MKGSQFEEQIADLRRRGISRRELLRHAAGMSLALPLVQAARLPMWAELPPDNAVGEQSPNGPAAPPQPGSLTPEDEAFLNGVEHASFLFFWEQGNPETGLIKDRCDTRTNDTSIVGSIASTGFGLTAICIAHMRGFVSYEDARRRVVKGLSFLWHKLPTHRGFYFHFANINTGERVWDSEVSSVDTSILLCGVLTCKQHFAEDQDIVQLAHAIYDRVDWDWVAEDTSILSMGWTPEYGFLPSKWGDYSELMMIYLLGIGSSSHPLDPGAWLAWKRNIFEYDGLRYIGSYAPLFVNQYSQAWFDFRNKRDRFADYFQNSVVATDVHRLFCLSLNERFSDYSNALWGISASDSKEGYVVWGGPPALGPIDGTVVPCATGGSIPFLPAETMRVLKTIHDHYPNAWGRYGFVDAFNPLTNWYDTDVIGIDVGITMLMAENARSGFVWETFMKNPEAQRGMQMAGFTSYTPPVPEGVPAKTITVRPQGGSHARQSVKR